ncbi:MAG: L,D-transpeptidase family protein [Burkholderiaceae bacterium]
MADRAGTDGRLMLRQGLEGRPGFRPLACLLIAAIAMASSFAFGAPDKSGRQQNLSTHAMNPPDPDVMLIEVYKALADNRLRDAMRKADLLVESYPTFHLGHLLRGDLLLMHARPVNVFGAASNAPEDKLKNLRDEAIARIRSLRERPNPELVPREVLQLRTDQKNVLVVDAKRSRLYVYANQDGELKLVTDYYISHGKLGVDKFKEGDQKTPLGVYYITANLPGPKLPDFYGPGALPISYPNEWDKLNGRGGSGIWLHGTPSNSYSRPPLSSDGCVVLTNPDLLKLTRSVEVGKTPVVIASQVEFVTRARHAMERSQSNTMVEEWRRDLENLDSARLLAHYSKRFKSEHGENLQTWFAKQGKPKASSREMTVALRDVSLFRYPAREEMIVATFTQETQIGKSKHSMRKRQYWAKENARWKIVSETNW